MKTKSFKILVADDDPMMRFILSTILRRQGHIVEVSENGKEAIKLFTHRPDYFNVLITDHDMPLVFGLELVSHLRKHGIEVKIVVVSGSLTGELMNAYRNKHVDSILQKPFLLENLSFALNGILKPWKAVVHA